MFECARERERGGGLAKQKWKAKKERDGFLEKEKGLSERFKKRREKERGIIKRETIVSQRIFIAFSYVQFE